MVTWQVKDQAMLVMIQYQMLEKLLNEMASKGSNGRYPFAWGCLAGAKSA